MKYIQISPIEHANIDALFFGIPSDTIIPIHYALESSFNVMPDIRHNIIFHSAFGIELIDRILGKTVKYENKEILVADITKRHIIREFGYIPTLSEYLSQCAIQDWMSGTHKRKKATKKHISLVD